MKKIIALSAIIFAFAGCKKDDVAGDTPVLTFKTASALDIPADVKMLTFTFQLKDGDGDTEDSLYVNDIRFGTDKYQGVAMPSLESHKGIKLDAEVTLYVSDEGDNIFMRLRDGRDPNIVPNPDTLQYRVFVKDNAGHSSDTLLLPKVAIHR